MDKSITKIAVVIPCYKVGAGILNVLDSIGPEVTYIIVIDDACPLGTGAIVKKSNLDTRVKVISHSENRGVGAAVKTGYEVALNYGAEIVVKLDGDGQMDPAYLPKLILPIENGRADYCKGNRFYSLSILKQMPVVRLFGNLALTYISRISSGNWRISDPNNGYTAISSKALRSLELIDISDTYFFESDMIFRICLGKHQIEDVDIPARYSEEVSSLKISHSLVEFSLKHMRNLLIRKFKCY